MEVKTFEAIYRRGLAVSFLGSANGSAGALCFAPFADEIDQQTTRAVASLLSVVLHGRLTTIVEGVGAKCIPWYVGAYEHFR